jgi:tetratricopeptide (TPR) repeat protein
MNSRIAAVVPSQVQESSDAPADPSPDDPSPQALQGLGGVGKTALAIEYAWRYQADYDLVCWIHADQISLVRSALAGLATAVGLELSATGIDLTTTGVLDALRRGDPYSRWLLIFDNADQPEELLPFIPSGPGDVLITSRNHRWQSVAEMVRLDVFQRVESVQFLHRRVPRGLMAADADQLADKLGDLPLALVQASAVLVEGGMAVGEYLRLLDERTAQILEKGTSPEYPTSMTAAWQISVARLRQQSPQALELLRCCAFFGPEPIPRDIFNLGSEESRTGVGELISDPIDLSTAISTLGRFALVRIDVAHIIIHRLIQALLRAELHPDEQREYRQDAHAMLAAGAPGNPADVRTWPRYADLLAHASSPATDLAHCREPMHRALALDIVRYLYVSGDFPSCQALAEQYISQWTADSGPDDPHVLDMKRHLGNALRDLGHTSEAYQVIETTLRGAERVLGLENPLTLALRNAFGADLRARGDFSAARELDKETWGLHDEVFGPADPQTLRVVTNVAHDHGLNSDYIAARDLYKQVYRLWNDARTGVSATEILNSLTGLARAVRLCGNFIQARNLGEDARHYGLDKLGPEHHLTLRATTDLSIAMRLLPGAHEESFELASGAYDLCRRRRGDENPDTVAAAISVSNVQRIIGQLDEATKLATAALEIYPAIYSADHPYYWACKGNLAILRRLAGDPVEAHRLNEEALARLDARLTRNHLFSLTVAVNLASDLAATGDFGLAGTVGHDTLARLTSLLGKDHPLSRGCAANLFADLRADGAHEEADLLLGEYSMTDADVGGPRLDFDFDPPPI